MADSLIYDEPAELAVLGSIIADAQAFDQIADDLEADHFGRDHHRHTFTAMRRLHDAGKPIEPVTVKDELGRMKRLDEVGLLFVAHLGDGVPRSTNIRYYASIVKDHWLRRELHTHADRVMQDAKSGAATGAELLERMDSTLHHLGTTAIRSEWVSGKELAQELYGVVEDLHARRGTISGVSSGFVDLDRDLRGLQPGDLILLGARPSMGKTAIAMQIAHHAARSAPVAFFSLEMGRVPIGLRGVIALSQVDGWRLLHGRLSDVDQRRAQDGLSQISESQFYIDESPILSPTHLRAKLRRLKARAGSIGMVLVDYLQLMAPNPEDKRENKTNQVSAISRSLKLMAREFNVPFVVLSQLNRGLERSGDKRPSMADLRDSGALEQDADVVLLLHRPEVYEPDKVELKGVADLIIAKQRNGPIGTVDLTWRAEQMRFESRVAEFTR
jgi:replicative DNA helicase